MRIPGYGLRALSRLWFCGVLLAAASQCWAAPDAISSLDSWRKATVKIECGYPTVKGASTPLAKTEPVGTGVIFWAPGLAPNDFLLVSAKHVFDAISTNVIALRFSWYYADPAGVHKETTAFLKSGVNDYVTSLDGADLACLAITLRPEDIGAAAVPAIRLSELAAPSDIYMGASVLALGYPDVAGSGWDTAIMRQGIIASLAPRDQTTSPFLVDANIYPGNSGGPVFKAPIGMDRTGKPSAKLRAAFLGIVIRRGQRKEDVYAGQNVYSVPTAAGPQTAQALVGDAIGFVEPATRVRQLLLKAAAWAKAARGSARP
ncbi:MAG TPA: serine protease [Armatimonadota bacterium]|jgi:hypothetical protein